MGPLLTSAAEPAAVARLVEGAAGAAHRAEVQSPGPASRECRSPGLDAMLTANPAAEVSPDCGILLPKSSRRTRSGALGTPCAPGGASEKQVAGTREGRVPDSWTTSRQERAGTTETKEPAGQEAEGAGKGKGERR